LRLLEVFHDGADEFLGVLDAFLNELDVHGRLAGLARALTINAVLTDQDKGVGEKVQGDREAAAFGSHHELKVVEFAGAIFIHGHLL
jgi:hypothetical protein